MISLPNSKTFKLDDYPLYNLNRTSATYTDEIDKALAEVGISSALWRVLGIINDQNPSTITDIARRSVIKTSTLTRMLDRMERNGYIVRTVWEKDKRISHVTMTAKGSEALNLAFNVAENVYTKAFEGIPKDQIQIFMETLKAVRSNLSRSPYVTNK